VTAICLNMFLQHIEDSPLVEGSIDDVALALDLYRTMLKGNSAVLSYKFTHPGAIPHRLSPEVPYNIISYPGSTHAERNVLHFTFTTPEPEVATCKHLVVFPTTSSNTDPVASPRARANDARTRARTNARARAREKCLARVIPSRCDDRQIVRLPVTTLVTLSSDSVGARSRDDRRRTQRRPLVDEW